MERHNWKQIVEELEGIVPKPTLFPNEKLSLSYINSKPKVRIDSAQQSIEAVLEHITQALESSKFSDPEDES